MPTLTWAPSPGEITASDNGTSFTIGITSRIAIVLSRADYPPENMKIVCDPADALGSISNLPIVPAEDDAVRYEGVKPGQCIISNGNFDVIINIVANP